MRAQSAASACSCDASAHAGRGRGSRNLGHQLDDVRVVDKEVADDAAEAQDEDGRHALEAQAQPDADHGCMATAASVNALSERSALTPLTDCCS